MTPPEGHVLFGLLGFKNEGSRQGRHVSSATAHLRRGRPLTMPADHAGEDDSNFWGARLVVLATRY